MQNNRRSYGRQIKIAELDEEAETENLFIVIINHSSIGFVLVYKHVADLKTGKIKLS
jgi:hypothetical protein